MAPVMYNIVMKKDNLERVVWSNLAVESVDLNLNNADVAGSKKASILNNISYLVYVTIKSVKSR